MNRESALTGHFYLQITETSSEGELIKLSQAMGEKLGKTTGESMSGVEDIIPSASGIEKP